MMMMFEPTPQPTDKRRSVDVWVQSKMKTWATDPSGKVPVANGRLNGLDSIGHPARRSSASMRSIRADAAAICTASPVSSYGKPIVNYPRSQVALMRAPCEFVDWRCFVMIACMLMMFLIGQDYPLGSQA